MTSSQAQDPGEPESAGQQPEAEPEAAQRIEIIGDATPEQVAALVAVLSAMSEGSVDVDQTGGRSIWSAPARTMRRPHTPGHTVWQHSLRP